MDEQVVTKGIASPQRLLSHRSSKRRRHDSGSESEVGLERQASFQKQASRQMSLHKQASEAEKKEILKKEEEWDKEIPEVGVGVSSMGSTYLFDISLVQISLGRVIAKNAPEWWIITFGLIAAGISGALFPAFAIFFGEILEVFVQPPGRVLDSIHLWAGLFVLLAVVSGLCNFLKVCTA